MDDSYAHDYESYVDWHWWFQGRGSIIELFLHKYINSDSHPHPSILAIGGGQFEDQLFPEAENYYTLNKEFFSGETDVPNPPEKVIGGLPRLPFKTGTFNVVVLFDVLEHIHDHELGIQDLTRVLGRDGILLLTVPAFSFLWSDHDETNEHFRRYNYSQINSLFNKVDLDILDWTYFNTFLFPVIAVLRLFQDLLPRGSGESSAFEMNRPGRINQLLSKIFKLETLLLNLIRFPFGVSLLVVAQKR